MAFYILSRFRLPLVPVLIAFAGLGSAAILQALLETKIRRGLVLLLLAVGLVAINRPGEPDRLQFSDYQNMARFHSISNQPERGREILEEGIARTRQIVARSDSPDYRFRLALMLLLAGKNREEVRAELDQALRLDPPPSLKPSIEHLRRQL